jgi:hypothetical protein
MNRNNRIKINNHRQFQIEWQRKKRKRGKNRIESFLLYEQKASVNWYRHLLWILCFHFDFQFIYFHFIPLLVAYCILCVRVCAFVQKNNNSNKNEINLRPRCNIKHQKMCIIILFLFFVFMFNVYFSQFIQITWKLQNHTLMCVHNYLNYPLFHKNIKHQFFGFSWQRHNDNFELNLNFFLYVSIFCLLQFGLQSTSGCALVFVNWIHWKHSQCCVRVLKWFVWMLVRGGSIYASFWC